MNQFGVGASGKVVQISNIAPQPRLAPREALNLAAWLAATALPLKKSPRISAGKITTTTGRNAQ